MMGMEITLKKGRNGESTGVLEKRVWRLAMSRQTIAGEGAGGILR